MPETVMISETPTKISLASDMESSKCISKESPNYNLAKFRLSRILNNNTVRKSVALLGTFPDISEQDAAIVIFEKKAFKESDVQTPNCKKITKISAENDETKCVIAPSFFSEALQVQTEFINNIYGSYLCMPGPELSGIKTTVVYPATEKHIEKYTICQKYVIRETPKLYQQVTLPFIESSQFSLEWVYNILEHKQETERIVFEDTDPETGFVLLPDLKWDGKNVETLYLLAITQNRNIKSLRDLRANHLPMLRNMRSRIAETIKTRYGLDPSQLRMYFHYQPSFYHFHLHINPLRNDAPGIWCEKSHMLDTVINNLELLHDYYELATLPFVLYDGNKLLASYETVLNVKGTVAKRKAEFTDQDDEAPTKKRDKCADKKEDTK